MCHISDPFGRKSVKELTLTSNNSPFDRALEKYYYNQAI
jgi:hypothetical protein